jgi:hypothetical protein
MFPITGKILYTSAQDYPLPNFETFHSLYSPLVPIMPTSLKATEWFHYAEGLHTSTCMSSLQPACHSITLFVSVPELFDATIYIVTQPFEA